MTAKNIVYKSKSDGRRHYHCKRDRTGKVVCDCKGWIFRRQCWHSEKVLAMA